MKSEKAKEKKKENCDISFYFILYISLNFGFFLKDQLLVL